MRIRYKAILITIVLIIPIVLVHFITPTVLLPEPLCPPKNISLDNASSIENKDIVYVLDCLSSGDRSVYERKAVISTEFPEGQRKEYLAWGDEVVPIYGSIGSIPPNTTSLADKFILVKAVQNGEQIFEQFVTTDHHGRFNSSFYPPQDGTIQVTANLLGINLTSSPGTNSTPTEAIITVVATQAWLPLILILIFVTISTAIIVGFWLKAHKKDGTKNEKLLRIGIVPVTIPITLAFFVLYKFPPFDEAGNTAFATALIAPLAAYIFEVIKR